MKTILLAICDMEGSGRLSTFAAGVGGQPQKRAEAQSIGKALKILLGEEPSRYTSNGAFHKKPDS